MLCSAAAAVQPAQTFTTLLSFDGSDGNAPLAALVQATDGNLYGTTDGGGANGDGTVFTITPSGTLTTLYSFCSQSGCADGYNPINGLVQATDRNFYGETQFGGANGEGTVFKITPSGGLTVLGSVGLGILVQDTNGKLYGTTYHGGTNGDGTVFSLSVGLGPFVETQPTSGKVGKFVKVLGTNLTHATRVTFNGTPAVFSVEGSSISTRVPEGATTGTVQVTIPSGALSSNVPFRVIQ